MEIDQKTKHVNDEDFFVVRMTMMGGFGEPYKQSDHQYGESYRLFPHLSIICIPNDGMFQHKQPIFNYQMQPMDL